MTSWSRRLHRPVLPPDRLVTPGVLLLADHGRSAVKAAARRHTSTGEPRASERAIRLAALLAGRRGLTDRGTRLAAACSVLADRGYPDRAVRGLSSFRDLSKGEAHVLIEVWS